MRVGNAYSSVHTQYEGVPQGSVLSTTCFIVAMNNIGHSLPQGVRSSIFVDDYLISIAGNNKREVQNILQTAIDNITKWAENCGFKFSSSKTCAVTFTRQHSVPEPLLKLYKEPIQYKNSTKFLGIIFDTRLTWEPHIEHLKIECTKTLNMIKVLSHTTWGADRKTLLMLHNSLILSKIDYGCQIYASATKSKLSKLNPVHNAGLRLSTGAFKSTPIESLYAESGFYSLEYRRIKICLRYYMRTSTRYSPFLDRIIKNTSYLATFENHPRYLRPFNIRISSLLKDFNMNPNLDTRNCSKMVPWRMPEIKFCKNLTSVKKSEIPDYQLRKLFYEHFNEHQNDVPIYTDGSKSGDGVGAAVVYPDHTTKRRLLNDASVFTAELFAILLALKEIFRMKERSFVIASDSQSALAAIERFNPVHPLVMEIQEWLYLIFSLHKNVQFCWVPSHIGIQLNEIADTEAKSAIRERGISNVALPCTDYYPVIDNILKTKWQEEWSVVTHNKLRKVKSTVSQWSTALHRNRHWEVILARLRLGHTRYTHSFLMEKKPPPQCPVCNTQITVEHFMVECPKYKTKRNIYFNSLCRNGQRLTLQSILEESDTFNITRVMNYLRDIDLLNEI